MKRIVACLLLCLMATLGPSQRALMVAETQVGKMEVGNNGGLAILPYQLSTSIKPGEPWCSAFVYWCHIRAGVSIPGPARSYAWSPTWFKSHLVDEPASGDVFGIYFKELGRIGHVGIVSKVDGSFIETIEGNTNADGSREGNGVWKKRRLKRQIRSYSRWE